MIKSLQDHIKESLYFNTYKQIKKYLGEKKANIIQFEQEKIKKAPKDNDPSLFIDSIMNQSLRSRKFPPYMRDHAVKLS